MTNPNNWPDPDKPGVPMNPERDGWHWVRHRDAAFCTPVEWRVPCGWVTNNIPMLPKEVQSFVVDCCEYLGPCLTPAEVAAREQAAAVAMREACAAVHDYHADGYARVYLPNDENHHRAFARRLRGIEIPAIALDTMLAQARRDGMEEAAKEVDCGCDIREAVLARLESQGEKRAAYLCTHNDVCCALQAAAIRAAAKENP